MVECNPCQCLKNKHMSQILILVVVVVGLFVDCILFSVVGPILPAFLYDIKHENESKFLTSSPLAAPNYSSLVNYSSFNNSTEGKTNGKHINETQISGSDMECYQDKESLHNENLEVGILVSIKALVQFVVNPIVGKLLNRLGYDLPLFSGFFIMFTSSLMFAFSTSYAVLAVARGLQGIGSSLTVVPGFSLIARTFPDDKERGKVMAMCSAGLATGGIIGPPFGSIMYSIGGMPLPFLTIAAITLLDGEKKGNGRTRSFFLIISLHISQNVPPTPYLVLLRDPYIVMLVVALCFIRLNFGVLSTTIPLRMMEVMCLPTHLIVSLGLIPCAVTYIICINFFAFIFPVNIYEIIGPSTAFGLGFALSGSSIYPMLAYLVDLRHTKVYGGIYALTDMAYCFGYFVGPLLGGYLVKVIGFTWLMVIMGLLEIAYAPVLILMRNVPGKDENKPILSNEEHPAQLTPKSDTQDQDFHETDNSDKGITPPFDATKGTLP
ncbi:hypothetical protein GDO86_006731 [Hymenochirus boettgeri]|uniref:Major facilitator superfamily (MFS) profile domain-containing protein n=1 Tax=Hymenochirus boettgeri TaxID=247094 RepID=A0A8T2JF57_9PIPI|nr:hypothetical protein GDO86_006731 [Hymenochirus boettgeri]